MNKKLLTVIIIVGIICVVTSIYFHTKDDKDHTIKLMEVNSGCSAGISAIEQTNGQVYYDYYVDGLLYNLPSNLEGYNLTCFYHTSNGTYVRELNSSELQSKQDSYFSSYKTCGLACVEVYQPMNITNVTFIIFDPSKKVVFNQTIDFNMSNMDTSKLNQ